MYRDGHEQVLRVLQEAGVDINATSGNGLTLLHISCAYAHEQIVRLLLEAGANMEAWDCGRIMTPLLGAALFGHLECARLLVATACRSHPSRRLVVDLFLRRRLKAKQLPRVAAAGAAPDAPAAPEALELRRRALHVCPRLISELVNLRTG